MALNKKQMTFARGMAMLIICGALFGSACSNTSNYAPIEEGNRTSLPGGKYIVQSGDTLYSIAWSFGKDFRELAILNKISPPYEIQVSQVIYLENKPHKIIHISKSKPLLQNKYKKPAKKITPEKIAAPKIHFTNQWCWPAAGRVKNNFSLEKNNKGINIAGKLHTPVLAANSGTVVYSGNGLKGYGNLIIIKHNEEYLSAYAHNEHILVHEGQMVKRGQKIASMGSTDNGQILLHFEIRKAGKPVDPLLYLQKRVTI